MKFLIVLCLVEAICAEAALHAVLQAKWNTFKAAHGKEYGHHEEPRRLGVFLNNAFHIETHNERFANGLESFELGHNEFSDMTHEEFKNNVLMKTPREIPVNVSQPLEMPGGLQAPASVDWSHTTPTVKNQGSCGSCYTFGAAGALEGQLFRKNGQKVVLSEQHLIDCSQRFGNSGCNGGLESKVFEFVKSHSGVYADGDYGGYKGRLESCRTLPGKTKHAAVTSYRHLSDEASIVNGLATYGPMAAGISAGSRAFQFYKTGIFNDATCGNNLDHSVVLVGYGSGFFKIKNSWGTTWGEGGFMRLARDKCAINRDGILPTV